MDNKNSALLNEFFNYCVAHPEYRFWQALRNWSGIPTIAAGSQDAASGMSSYLDTFYWEGKTK